MTDGCEDKDAQAKNDAKNAICGSNIRGHGTGSFSLRTILPGRPQAVSDKVTDRSTSKLSATVLL